MAWLLKVEPPPAGSHPVWTDDEAAAELWRRVAVEGYRLDGRGAAVPAGRVRQLLEDPDSYDDHYALVDGWRDVLAAEGLLDA